MNEQPSKRRSVVGIDVLLRGAVCAFLVSVVTCSVKVQDLTASVNCQVTNFIKSATIIELNFSQQMPSSTFSNLAGAIDIKLRSLKRGYDFEWAVKSRVSDTQFLIEMTYFTSIYLKQLDFYFINPYAITSSSGSYLSLDSYSLQVWVGPVVHFTTTESSGIDAMSMILVVSMIVFTSMYILLYLFRVLKEGLSMFWAWFDLIQLYNLFLFIDTYHFDNVASLLRKSAYLNFWRIDWISYDILSVFRESDSIVATSSVPYRFIVENYQTYFLQNSFFVVCIICGGLFMLMLSMLFCRTSSFGAANVIRNLIQFSLPIRGTLIACCTVWLSAFLFIKNFTGTLNIIMCVVMLIYYAFATGWLVQLLNTGQPTPLKEEAMKDKYGSLYEGLILKAISKRNLNVFFMLRKVVVAALVVFLDNAKMAQMICLLVIQILYMGLIGSKLPYMYSKNNVCMVLSEMLLLIFLLLMSAWIIFDYLGEDFIYFDNRMSISWFLHALMILSVFTRVLGFIFEAVSLYTKESDKSKLEEKLMKNRENDFIDDPVSHLNGMSVKQKMLFFHHRLKGRYTESNEEDDNPDDFQFIEQPDVFQLIEKERQEILEEELEEQNKKLTTEKINTIIDEIQEVKAGDVKVNKEPNQLSDDEDSVEQTH